MTHHIIGLSRATGWFAAARILARRALNKDRTVSVRLPALQNKLEINPTDSDPFVMSQIFGWHEYFPGQQAVLGLQTISQQWIADGIRPVIVDGGANTGYSSIFFAQLFPQAIVLAVEPDGDSYATLRRNCRTWDSIKPVHGALWENEGEVLLQKGNHGSWSSKVGSSGETVRSFTLESLLNGEGRARILILKLDIEGAEREVVAASPDPVRSAMLIMVEPHDFMRPGSCSMGPLFQILADQHFDTQINGENLFFFSPELLTTAVAR